jgi:hypothetical protein
MAPVNSQNLTPRDKYDPPEFTKFDPRDKYGPYGFTLTLLEIVE